MTDEDSSERNANSLLWSWKSWAIAIVPALVAGIFAIGPTIYQEYSKPKSELTFDQVSGPVIGSANGYRQISLIKIVNAGKTPLTGVSIEVTSPNAVIESSAMDSPGLQPKVVTRGDYYGATVERILPTEMLTASIMTVAQASQPTLKLLVRSNEVLGSRVVNPAGTIKPEIISAILAVAGTMTATIALMWKVLGDRRINSLVSRIIKNHSRADIITFICGISGVIHMADELLYKEHDVTWRRAGDLFLFMGLGGDDIVKRKCKIGLRAMLSVSGGMLPESANLIRQNLELLDAKMEDDQFKEMRDGALKIGEDLLEAKRLVVKMFYQDGVFSTSNT